MMLKAWSTTEYNTIGWLWFFKVIPQIQGHTGPNIGDCQTNWEFPWCNSNINWPMATKWWKSLKYHSKSAFLFFQGHLSNYKVTWDNKLPIFNWIENVRTVTPALLFVKFIHIISRLWGLKNKKIECNFSKITRPVTAIRSFRFPLLVLSQHWSRARLRAKQARSLYQNQRWSILVIYSELPNTSGGT